MKWFRMYHDIIHDTKFLMMSEAEQLLWIKLLCLASKSDRRGFVTLNDDEVCFTLRLSPEVWRQAKDKFRVKGLIDFDSTGAIAICAWNEDQYESDSAAERMKRYRKNKKEASPLRNAPVTVTPPDTDTEQKQKQKQKQSDFSLTLTRPRDEHAALPDIPPGMEPITLGMTPEQLEQHKAAIARARAIAKGRA